MLNPITFEMVEQVCGKEGQFCFENVLAWTKMVIRETQIKGNFEVDDLVGEQRTQEQDPAMVPRRNTAKGPQSEWSKYELVSREPLLDKHMPRGITLEGMSKVIDEYDPLAFWSNEANRKKFQAFSSSVPSLWHIYPQTHFRNRASRWQTMCFKTTGQVWVKS